MRILISGIHGFVGSNLVRALRGEHEIYGVDIVAPEKEGVCRTFGWDELEAGGIPEVDAIIHLAGLAHDTKEQEASELYYQVNRDLTVRMFDYFRAHPGIRKFLFFSSVKAAAERVEGVLTEEVAATPQGPYGVSKRAAEIYILNALAVSPEEFRGRGVYVLRPCMIHGPGNKGNLNLLYKVVSWGMPWPLGAFENRRTFTSVENVCFVVEGLLKGEVDSGIYNVGDDEALSTNELIEEICASLGKRAHIWKLPKGMMEGVARFSGWIGLPLDPERLRKLTENYVASNGKIQAALGVERMPVGAKEGLQETLRSFRNSG